jgi:hypothetical protein
MGVGEDYTDAEVLQIASGVPINTIDDNRRQLEALAFQKQNAAAQAQAQLDKDQRDFEQAQQLAQEAADREAAVKALPGQQFEQNLPPPVPPPDPRRPSEASPPPLSPAEVRRRQIAEQFGIPNLSMADAARLTTASQAGATELSNVLNDIAKGPDVKEGYDARGNTIKTVFNSDTGQYEQVGGAHQPTGSPIFDKDGNITGYMGGQGPKLTEKTIQGKVLQTAGRTSGPAALEHFDSLATLGQSVLAKGGLIGNAFMTEEAQIAKYAIENTATLSLYALSGATANPDEAKKRAEGMTPQPGDKPGTLKYKRNLVIDAQALIDTQAAAGLAHDEQLPPDLLEEAYQLADIRKKEAELLEKAKKQAKKNPKGTAPGVEATDPFGLGE